jgi:hypothetical protein
VSGVGNSVDRVPETPRFCWQEHFMDA